MISKHWVMAGLFSLSSFLVFSTAQAIEGGGGSGSGSNQSASGQYPVGQAPETISMPSTPTSGNSSIDVDNAGTGQTPQGMNDTTTGSVSPASTPTRGAATNGENE